MMLIKFIIDLIVFIFLVTLKVFSPILSLRVGNLISNRIGHYAANTEIYLCEKEILKNNSRKIGTKNGAQPGHFVSNRKKRFH